MRMLRSIAMLACAGLMVACGHVGDVQKAGDVLGVAAPAVAEIAVIAEGDQSEVARVVLEVNALAQGTRQAVTVGCAMVLTGTDDGSSLFDRVIDPVTRYCAEREGHLSGGIP